MTDANKTTKRDNLKPRTFTVNDDGKYIDINVKQSVYASERIRKNAANAGMSVEDYIEHFMGLMASVEKKEDGSTGDIDSKKPLVQNKEYGRYKCPHCFHSVVKAKKKDIGLDRIKPMELLPLTYYTKHLPKRVLDILNSFNESAAYYTSSARASSILGWHGLANEEITAPAVFNGRNFYEPTSLLRYVIAALDKQLHERAITEDEYKRSTDMMELLDRNRQAIDYERDFGLTEERIQKYLQEKNKSQCKNLSLNP